MVEGRKNLNLCEVYGLGWRSFYRQSHKHRIHIYKACKLLECRVARAGPALSEHVLSQCMNANPNDYLLCAGCTSDPMKGNVYDP